MKLPIQAKPIMRKVSTAKMTFSDGLGVIPQARFECICNDAKELIQRAAIQCERCNNQDHAYCQSKGYDYCSGRCCIYG